MAKQSKILDAMALSSLPRTARVRRLASRWRDKGMTLAQANAMAKLYCPAAKRQDAALAIFNETHRQQSIHRQRRAGRAGVEKATKGERLSLLLGNPGYFASAVRGLVMRAVGRAVASNFPESTLALMSLISGKATYKVTWRSFGLKPAPCATIAVEVTRKTKKETLYYLVYKAKGSVKTLRLSSPFDTKSAWAEQIPASFLEALSGYQAQGYTFRSDLLEQCVVVLDDEGKEVTRDYWTGATG